MANPAPSYDPNICIGFQVPEHVYPVEGLNPEWLCPPCGIRLNSTVARPAPAPSAPRECIAGGHPAGARYYDCIACYGD
jgi:hypothetical protein